jgi:thiol-disulfide isomerase/thioredoxin
VRPNQLVRLAWAGAIVGLALVALSEAGVLFNDSNTLPSAPQQAALNLGPANTEVDTPNARGLTVGLKEGQLAPDFEFSSYDGERHRLSDYRGRAVFLNFWATWCGPCRVELPDMQALLRDYPDDLAVIAVNNGEPYAPAQRYLDQIGVQLTAFAHDPGTAIVRLYGLFGMPTSYFIDREGVITRVHTGQLSPNVMRSAVQEALAATGAATLGYP